MTVRSTPANATLELSNEQFRYVSGLVTGISGIQLPRGKESLVRARLARRVRALGLASMQEYLDAVERDTTRAELAEMVDALTTNKTSFFREIQHFRLLQRSLLPDLARGHAPIRIWSAGCSTGEEPYSIAMVAREALGRVATHVHILATDISSRVLERARGAEYDVAALRDVPAALQDVHFEPVPGAASRLRIARPTGALVQFVRLNLMGEWSMRNAFDVIFCRNVMIYFDKPTQERLVARFTALLAPGGHLMVGHSESLSGLRHDLDYVQPATYRRAVA